MPNLITPSFSKFAAEHKQKKRRAASVKLASQAGSNCAAINHKAAATIPGPAFPKNNCETRGSNAAVTALAITAPSAAASKTNEGDGSNFIYRASSNGYSGGANAEGPDGRTINGFAKVP
jgi:hypothetical protein